MFITIEIKVVYGNQAIYPVCDNAKRFASLTGKKTFSHHDLQDIEALGFEVRQHVAPLAFRKVA